MSKVSVFQCLACGGGMRCKNSRPMVALNDSGTVRQYFCRECGEPDTTVSFRVGRGGFIADRVKEKMLGLVPSEDYSDREMSAISEAISLISASFMATEKATKRKAA